jgi:hypothetical protein
MTYDHIQRSPMYLIVLAPAVVLVCVGLLVPATPWALFAGLAALLFLSAFCFQYERVRDEGDSLAIRYGPIPTFRKRIAYSQITAVEAGRSSWLDGWGIHYMPGRGWIFNLWGFSCVVVHLGKKTVRIGTDDATGLAQLLKMKIEATAAKSQAGSAT